LIAIDCKDLARPVNVTDVAGVIDLFKDIGANKGVIVSARGFTSTALTRGEKAGLNLYRLVDCGDHDWKADVSIPVLCEFRHLKSFSLKLSGIGRVKIPAGDPRDLDIYDGANRHLGKVADLLDKRWNDGDLPIESGTFEDLDFIGQPTKIMYQDEFFEVKITATITTKRNWYFGNLPLAKISGFKDEIEGGLVTKGFTTAVMDIVEIQESWQRLGSVDELAVKPVLRLGWQSHYEREGSPSVAAKPVMRMETDSWIEIDGNLEKDGIQS
jgi:hypothetical protein